MALSRKLFIACLVLFSIIVMGVLGFHFIEGLTYLEALYATVVTLTTVGYGDFAPVTEEGMIFDVFLIIVGVGTMLYTVGMVTESMIEGRLRIVLGRGRLKKMITKMRNHYIICGFGRIGGLICKELAREKVDFLVVEKDAETIHRIEDEGYVYYKGDATSEKTLLDAGILKAKGIICVLPTDAENLYIILTARELKPDIYILSRAVAEESESRLLRAGANRVESPYLMGGMRMAMAILRPAMLDFVEITTMRQSLELRMDEISICEGSPYAGKSLAESDIRNNFGLIVVAVKKASGRMIFNPLASYVIEAEDKLVAMGEVENINQFTATCLL